ncbi:Cna B-type domain-containing protein, partial [Agathobaculum desmolans]|uniref:Cna B-type domain-containing protein n=1 Tax=Agathobaculum desmolans TaxID=39484 RepID=UPI00248F0393
KLDLYADWQEETTTFTGTIRWDDFQNNDGCRPKAVKVGLVSSLTDSLLDDTVVDIHDDGTDAQSHTFTGLPITTSDASTEKITYKMVFLGYYDADGSYRAIHDTAATSGKIIGSTASKYDDSAYTTYEYAVNNYVVGDAAYIKLDHALITTGDNIAFTITWKDQSDNDGKRPGAIMMALYANGVPVDEYPLHNSQTGVRYVNSGECQLSEDGNQWTYIFKDFQKYHNGQAIDYTVAVKNFNLQGTFNADGYTTKYPYLDGLDHVEGHRSGAEISRPIELTDQTITVEWDDESNRDKIRPSSISVALVAYQWNNKNFRWEEIEVDQRVITGNPDQDTWTELFEDVKVYNGGEKIHYRAKVISDLNAQVPEGENGYTWTASDTTIFASHIRNVTNVPVVIEWNDQQNNDNIRPKTVIAQLYADGKKLEGADYAKLLTADSKADSWEYTFTNLPKYREGEEGEEILYTLSVEETSKDSLYGTYISMANGYEEKIVRYTASYKTADDQDTPDLAQSARAYVKLTHKTDQGTVYMYANWHDDQNRDGKRPASVLVDLYKQVDGKRTFVKTYTLTAGAANKWDYKLTGLPLMENGHEVKYLVDVSEESRQNLLDTYGYTVSMEGNVVHLYYTPAVGFVTGRINWQDNNDNDNIRPDKVIGELYANGEPSGQKLEFNAENDWTQKWNDVASYYKDESGVSKPVVYTIVVTTPEGYEVVYTPESTTTVDPHEIQIDLKHGKDVYGLEGKIFWSDNSDQDNRRPDSVNVQLYADGEKVVGKTADVTGKGNVWTVQFDGLEKYKDGKLIDYTIRLNDNTGKTYDAMTAGMNLYLSYQTAVADMSVAFRFDDNGNADGVRPDALYLNLTADGVPVEGADYQRTVYFDVDGVEWTFRKLPVYSADGNKIKYNATVSLDPQYGATDYDIVTSADIPLSENGNTNRVIVTLKRASDTGTESGQIFWFDANNQRGNRPDTLKITLRSDASTAVVGEYVVDSINKTVTDRKGQQVGTVTVSEWGQDGSSVWNYTISGLPQNGVYNGVSQEIFYNATAQKTGIGAWYDVIDGEDMTVSCTHKNYTDDVGSSAQDFAINVQWMDNQNAWNYRPNTNGVDIRLLANGVEYKTIHLTQTNAVEENPSNWTYTFEKLPTYLNGHAVVWTAEIVDVPKYTAKVQSHSDYATITMTQSIGFDFTINWLDSDNDDAVRPQSATVDVYGDGTKVGSVTLAGEDNSWTGSIKDLAVWRETGTTVPVSYSFRWDDATAAAMLDEGYVASPTQDGAPVEAKTFYWLSATEWGKPDGGLDDLTGQYQWETSITRNKETMTVYADILWDDDANRDGTRPESVQVQLYANGEPVGEPTVLTGVSTDSSWPITWEEQDVYDGGKPIVYTAEVVTVPNGYTAAKDETGLHITLTHTPDKTSVTGKVIWDDESEAHYEYNSVGDLIRTWYGIERVDVFMQLLINGNPYGEPVKIQAAGYNRPDGSKATYAAYTWDDVFVHENEGETNEYTIRVYSKALDDLLADGHTQTYDFSKPYEPSSTITHTLYDVRGKVYYLYNTDDEFLLKNIPVTAYLYDETNKTYTAVGSTVTDENGYYEIRNIPQGLLTVRATYQYGDYTYAGSTGVRLHLCDQNMVDILVNRDAEADSDLYRYAASGKAFYQTDRKNPATKTAVPKDSVVLLYQIVDGSDNAKYVGMATTDENGAYRFEKLASGKYLVNVAFNYNGSTYTYDNSDALADGLSFVVSGADAKWKDIVKQVNAVVDPGEPEPPVDPEEPKPEPKPEPCVVDGEVFFSDSGVHTTDPVEGADVYLYTAEENAQVGMATTDAKGHWSMEGIGAGDYIAVFSYAGNASRVLHLTISKADFEKGTYTAATQYFDRNADKTTASIRGVVLDEEGNQTAALVQIMNQDGDIVDVAYTDKSGMYDFTVAAGYTYRVKIVTVDSQTEYLTAGDPDDKYTKLDYYTLSGNFTVDGVAQNGATVAVYQQKGKDFELVTATLTDSKGDYSVKVMEAGNYRVSLYRDGSVYDTKYVSVGYQEYEPVVSGADGAYTITGSEPNSYDRGTLYDVTTKVVKTVGTLEAGKEYAFSGLAAGKYRLELVKGVETIIYYIDVPTAEIAVSYHVTVSGNVVDGSGKPMLGSVVTLLNSKGEQVGEQTIITSGAFSYKDLPADTYKIKIDFPVTGQQMLDRTTEETDSYGKSYPGGMTPGSVWSWNVNAKTVSGKVVDQNGKPVEGATVILKLDSNPDKAYGVQTDKQGNWKAGVMDGSYTVSAMYEFNANHIYHSTDSKPAVVNGADVKDVMLMINRWTVSGSVVRDGDGQPVADADIVVTYQDGTTYWTSRSDESGAFEIPAFTDTFIVTANKEGQAAQATISVNKDMSLTLKVGTPITVSGTVYDENGAIVPDGIVYYAGAANGKTYTDDQGRYSFQISAQEIGSYTMYAEAAGKTSDKVSVEVRTDTTQDLRLNNISGGGSGEVPTGNHLVAGVVTDNEGNRLANAIVTMMFGDDKTKTVKTSTSSDGAFRFTDVADGTYYLSVVYEAPNGTSYATNGDTPVHINGADKTDIVLAVSLSYNVHVSVVDTAGAPVGGASVEFFGASVGKITTGDDGKADCKLAGGKYDFKAVIGNRTSAVKTVTVDGDTAVELVVDTTGILYEEPTVGSNAFEITGHVIDPNGDPVKDADVTLRKFNIVTEEWDVVEIKKSAADGYYEFRPLEDGRYKVEVSYTQSHSVNTTVSNYEISGHALNETGNPYIGAAVNLYAKDSSVILQTVYTSEGGYYVFSNLKAGDYTVEIIPAEDASKKWTEDKSVAAGNSVVEGTVIDVNGKPVQGAVVTVTGDNGEWSMTTAADGIYSFEVPAEGVYNVTITYPDNYEIHTDGSWQNDDADPIKPHLGADDYVISGFVHDTDNNPITGAEVILQTKDGSNVANTTTNVDGYYEFTGVRPGEYVVIVKHNGNQQEYHIAADGTVQGGGSGEQPNPETENVQVSGVVVTDHKKPLSGAEITVRNVDSGDTHKFTANKDGKFDTGKLEKGRYEIVASYAHKYGTNESDPYYTTTSKDDAVLVIILSYVADVNGDGKDETVFAGKDDSFDTADDFYQYDMDKDGIKENIYAGEDNKPGTKDDWYGYDVDHDGENEQVFVGDDRIPGTQDDYYLADPDKDGEDEKIFADGDGIPGTKDDFYLSDPDNDGEDEKIHVGDDTQPGTKDDWYESDPDNDGKDEIVHVGEDGIPGTKDDWYEDDDGNKKPIDVVEVNFNANGGTVNGKSVYTVEKAKVHSLPYASRSGYAFDGWFTAPSGGTAITMADVRNFAITTTVYAHWTKNGENPNPGGGGSGGGGGGGSIGGGGAIVPPEEQDDSFTIVIEENKGATINPTGKQEVKKGEDLTVTVKAKDGFEIKDILVDGKSVGALDKYTFKNVTADHTFKVVAQPKKLLTEDHIAYITGYPDGGVHPTANITRAEVAMIFYRLLSDDARALYQTKDASFNDVVDGAWYEEAVATLTKAGILSGYTGNVFRPDEAITRAEFAAIAARFDDSAVAGEVKLTDIAGHWAEELIRCAANRGWVNGYNDNTFRPERDITRAEAMTLINRVLGRDKLTMDSLLDGMKKWHDNPASAWYYLAVQEATNSHDRTMENGVELWSALK